MNRRELLIKAMPLALVPFVKMPPLNGAELDGIEVAPRKFLIFADLWAIDFESIGQMPCEGWENIDAIFIPCRVRPGMSVRDHLQLVEQFDEKPLDNNLKQG